ncbi:MAG: hypothetical protein KGI27_12190 [Thaumarchaeota archaeon]|nr:hypothetical protein [Nitrososphaerota archaeon]
MKVRKTNKESSTEKQSIKHRNKIIAVAVISAIMVSIVIVSYKLDNTIVSSIPTIDSIRCDSMEQSVFHIHAHIDIFVNGQPIIVPASIGIEDNTCLYWLHTHKADGIIHIEAPNTRDFSLGEFLDIWKSTNTDLPPTNENPVIYVNGQVVTTTLKDTLLNAHDEIVLVYGNPPSNIPRFYQFPEGL